MTSTYGSAKVCPYNNQNCNLTTEGYTLEPTIEDILADTENRYSCADYKKDVEDAFLDSQWLLSSANYENVLGHMSANDCCFNLAVNVH